MNLHLQQPHEAESASPQPELMPFSRLVIDELVDVRMPSERNHGDDLKASIKAIGLLKSLLVRQPAEGGGELRVVAGRRRWRSILALIGERHFTRDVTVPVIFKVMTDAEALGAALAENIVRLNLHPVTEYEGFLRLAVTMTPAAIAEHFGVSERHVAQRLALARLAPEVRVAWVRGNLCQAQAEAFAINPDHDAQRATLAEMATLDEEEPDELYDLHPDDIRAALTAEAVRPDDRLSLFVGVEAYLEAGGTVREDLFEDARYLTDAPLLKRLARDKLEGACQRFIAAGWSWARVTADLPEWYRWPTLQPEIEHSDDEKKILASIAARLEGLRERLAGTADAKTRDEYKAAIARLEAEKEAIELSAFERGFAPDQKERSGCILSIEPDGGLGIAYGIIRPSAEALKEQLAGNTAATGDDTTGEMYLGVDGGSGVAVAVDAKGRLVAEADGVADAGEAKGLPSKLQESLSLTLTRAVAQVTADDPDLALALLAATLDQDFGRSPLRLTLGGKGFGPTHAAGERNRFPEALAKFVATGRGEVMTAIAARLAQALDMSRAAVRAGEVKDQSNAALVAHCHQGALVARLVDYFDAEAFFKAAPKGEALTAIADCDGEATRDKAASLKKPDLVARAVRLVAARGWLPAALRPPGYALPALAEAQAPTSPSSGEVDGAAAPADAPAGGGESSGESAPPPPRPKRTRKTKAPAS